eukprot:1151051-Pelagomonas_calceolata.AAC.3
MLIEAVLHHFGKEEQGFTSLHKMNSTPGRRLQQCCIMLRCQSLQGGPCGSVLVGGHIVTGVQADAGSDIALQPLHSLASGAPPRVGSKLMH